MESSVAPRFARTALLLGTRRLQRLQQAHVAVVGLGAVGSYAVEGLARAGVGRLRLVDFDVVEPSNINRQLFALESTCGRPKHEVARARVLDINPECRVEALNLVVAADTVEQVLADRPDLVIDAIDTLAAKVELLAAASRHGLPVVSAMGAARRTDPQAIRVAPLDQTHHCPLARRVRRRLRQLLGSEGQILCVYSTEPCQSPPRTPAAPPAAADAAGAPPGSRPPSRRLPLGSLPTVTGIFGLTVAHAALALLAGGLAPEPAESARSEAAQQQCR